LPFKGGSLYFPLPYPPCQIIDLAGNLGTPSHEGREKEEGKNSLVEEREGALLPKEGKRNSISFSLF